MSGKRVSVNVARRRVAAHGFKTWIELRARHFLSNYQFFRKRIGQKVKLLAVVKSNAYGHGIFAFSKLADRTGIDGFCVDSFIEGITLRRKGIRKTILVLGPTMLPLRAQALNTGITITVSNFETLHSLARFTEPPTFHLKIDTGMNRQGFRMEDVPNVARFLRSAGQALRDAFTGVYTHFASAKDPRDPSYTEMQFAKFRDAVGILREKGRISKGLIAHCAATGATLLHKKYHKSAVRIGIGLYGLWPSPELELQTGGKGLFPILSWRTVVSDIKRVPRGEFVGYDRSERTIRPTTLAVLPIGYWHGFPRALSGVGMAMVKDRRARVFGKVSMDMVVVDVTGIPCKIGDVVTLLGRDSRGELRVADVARQSGTIHYEFLTRLNPLIERVIV